MATITTAAQALAEINGTNLADGQTIKQLLGDLSTWIGTIQSGTVTPQVGPTELVNNTGGTASGTLGVILAGSSYAQADMQACQAGLASLNAQINNVLTKLVAAGVLTSV